MKFFSKQTMTGVLAALMMMTPLGLRAEAEVTDLPEDLVEEATETDDGSFLSGVMDDGFDLATMTKEEFYDLVYPGYDEIGYDGGMFLDQGVEDGEAEDVPNQGILQLAFGAYTTKDGIFFYAYQDKEGVFHSRQVKTEGEDIYELVDNERGVKVDKAKTWAFPELDQETFFEIVNFEDKTIDLGKLYPHLKGFDETKWDKDDGLNLGFLDEDLMDVNTEGEGEEAEALEAEETEATEADEETLEAVDAEETEETKASEDETSNPYEGVILPFDIVNGNLEIDLSPLYEKALEAKFYISFPYDSSTMTLPDFGEEPEASEAVIDETEDEADVVDTDAEATEAEETEDN